MSVTDDQGVTVTCPQDTLAAGESMTCTANGTATAGQYDNLGTATGTPPAGPPVDDEDPSHYFGADASIDIEKATNGADADSPTGPFIAVGDPVNWTYEVENTGNVALTNVSVTDDQGVTVTCPQDTLAAGESMTCTANGTATAGQYDNLGTATGTPPAGPPVDDEDPSHYFGADASIDIEKATNGADADSPTGPFIAVGDPVNWEYEVTNDGNVDLTDVEVTDSDVAASAIDCGAPDNDNVIESLAVGQTVTCEATGTATAGQYDNLGTATGTPPAGPPVDDEDPSHYFGADASIDIEKATNGADADSPTGPFIAVGATVTWEYEVTNDGNVDLTDVEVTDSDVAASAIDCGAPDNDNVIESLAVGQTVTCEATGTATAGQYDNLGTATGTPPAGPPVDDEDPSHYFGADASIDIEKATNGADADSPTGPFIAVGNPVNWTYEVENTGNVALTNVSVTDDQGVTVTCPQDTLAAGESMTCTANGTATAGQYDNLGTATGTPPAGPPVDDEDPSHYFGADASIDIEKATNGADADSPTGPFIAVGDPVNWTYEVENTGNVALTNVSVTDDQGVTVTCPQDTLAAGESMTCTANGTATAGQYDNLGTATGTPPAGPPVDDEDPSHYFGADASIDIEKATNGADADSPTGPFIAVGDPVNWEYEVTNDGNVDLTDVEVTDSDVAASAIDCGAPDNDNVIESLAVGQTVTCEATGTATAGQYDNLGTATGTPPAGPPVDDEDPSHYFGADASIDIEKATNGADADSPTGPFIAVGNPVNWTYEVENTGNVALTNVSVTDDQGVTVTCPQDTLAAGESMTCTANGTATAGQYDNLGTATGTPPAGPPVDDEDPSHYFGADASIDIEKATNGADADSPTGPFIAVGDPVNWTYEVENTGNVALTNVSVTDDQGVTVTCPQDTLAAGESMTCTANGTATAGQYDNLGTATGTPPAGPPVDDEDPSHYFGADASIDIEKATNGADADSPTGPFIAVGSTVNWTYEVENTGNVALTNVSVTDDQGVTVTCPQDTLAAGESMTCTANGTATAGQYDNLGTATGTPPAGPPVDDEDPSHYFGADASIDIEKATNGADADSPTGPFIAVGDPVNWTYEVENTGNVALTNVSVTDDQGVTVTCPQDTLAAGESMTCTANGTATAGQYDNLGTATGTPPAGPPVDDDDPSHYFGADASIDIEKATNGADADSPTGPFIAVGSTVNWAYIVTNTGNVALSDVTVTDDELAPTDIVCDGSDDNVIPSLLPGASANCAATGTAVAGQYDNIGTATGTPPAGDPPTDDRSEPLLRCRARHRHPEGHQRPGRRRPDRTGRGRG